MKYDQIKLDILKNKIDFLINRDQITKESEYLFKYLLGIKKMKKIDKLINILPKDSIERENHINNLTKIFNNVNQCENNLSKAHPPIFQILITYRGPLGIDTEESYWDI